MMSNDTQNKDNNKLCSFGEPFPNNGWIQCTSNSYRNEVYYYNVRSGCSTWKRPLADDIPIPQFVLEKFEKDRQSSDESNYSSFSRSDFSSKEDEFWVNKKSDIVSWLSACPYQQADKELSDAETVDSYEYKSISDKSELSIISEAKEPEIVYILPNENLPSSKRLMKIINSDSSSSSTDMYYSTKPFLKPIDISDLMVGKPIRKRRARVIRPKSPKSTSSDENNGAIACELNDIKTLNYNIDVSKVNIKKEKKNHELLDSSSNSSSSKSSTNSSTSSSSTTTCSLCNCSFECSTCSTSSTSSQTTLSTFSKRVTDCNNLEKYLMNIKQPDLSESDSP